MNSAVQRYVEAASGLTNITKARAEKIVRQLVKQGEAAADQAGDLVEELLDRQRQNRDALSGMVRTETQRAIKAMGLATNDDVDRLKKQVNDLKRELTAAQKAAGSSGAPAKKTLTAAKKTAKKTAAKKTAKKTAPAKKASTAKKTTAKKSSAKKAAKKTAAKKTTKKTTGGSSS